MIIANNMLGSRRADVNRFTWVTPLLLAGMCIATPWASTVAKSEAVCTHLEISYVSECLLNVASK